MGHIVDFSNSFPDIVSKRLEVVGASGVRKTPYFLDRKGLRLCLLNGDNEKYTLDKAVRPESEIWTHQQYLSVCKVLGQHGI